MGLAGAAGALALVLLVPGWFLPFHGEGIYQGNERAVGSVRNIAPHVGLFLGFLGHEVLRRDWRAVSVMGLLGLGFAVAFSAGGYWHTFHGHPLGLDWWKHWEMSIGLGGGLSLAVLFRCYNRPAGMPRPAASRAERYWTALTLWIVGGGVVANAWDGFVTIHGLAWPGAYRAALTVLYLLLAGAILIRWLSGAADALPGRVVAGLLVLLGVAGYLVSVPSGGGFALWVLVAVYSGCIAGSLGVFWGVLRARRG
jgi:hypothetical protein